MTTTFAMGCSRPNFGVRSITSDPWPTDDCSQTWIVCNWNMFTCTNDICKQLYSNSEFDLARCLALSTTYYDFISSSLGRNAFDSATKDRCMCVCPDQSLTFCGFAGCVDRLTDPANCGLCGYEVSSLRISPWCLAVG